MTMEGGGVLAMPIASGPRMFMFRAPPPAAAPFNPSIPPPVRMLPPPAQQPTRSSTSQMGPATVPTSQAQSKNNIDISQQALFDGKRMRKSVHRKTVDYNSSVIEYLENRIWQRDVRDVRAVQPDSLYSIDLVPPPAMLYNSMNCVTSKFIKQSTNKFRCPIFAVSWTPEGRRLVTGASSGEFTLWNGLTFNFETILQAHDTSVRTMRWSHNGMWMVTADHAGYIKYWQTNMNNVKMYQGHKEAVRGISFCPLDSKFASCSDDGTVRIWDFLRCHEERILRGHGADVKCVDWHPQKCIVASGSRDNQQPIKLWDPKSGHSLATIHAHKMTVMDLKWNKNGNWLLTASRDHLLKLFDIRNMKEEMQAFKGHKKEATALAWHPVHESLFVSGGSDGALMFWIVGTDREVGGMEEAHEGMVWSLDWHPLGHILASGSNDHSTKFWTRNRPGDSMRDQYNLNTLTVGEQEMLDYDTEPQSIPNLPGMGLEPSESTNADDASEDQEAAAPAIPGLDWKPEEEAKPEEKHRTPKKKVPYSKPIPKSFEDAWKDRKVDSNSTVDEPDEERSERKDKKGRARDRERARLREAAQRSGPVNSLMDLKLDPPPDPSLKLDGEKVNRNQPPPDEMGPPRGLPNSGPQALNQGQKARFSQDNINNQENVAPPQGRIGPQGNMGPQGGRGPNTNMGNQGNPGMQENMSSQGPQGHFGTQGNVPQMGNRNQQGNMGPPGNNPPQGMLGPPGPQGNRGMSGQGNMNQQGRQQNEQFRPQMSGQQFGGSQQGGSQMGSQNFQQQMGPQGMQKQLRPPVDRQFQQPGGQGMQMQSPANIQNPRMMMPQGRGGQMGRSGGTEFQQMNRGGLESQQIGRGGIPENQQMGRGGPEIQPMGRGGVAENPQMGRGGPENQMSRGGGPENQQMGRHSGPESLHMGRGPPESQLPVRGSSAENPAIGRGGVSESQFISRGGGHSNQPMGRGFGGQMGRGSGPSNQQMNKGMDMGRDGPDNQQMNRGGPILDQYNAPNQNRQGQFQGHGMNMDNPQPSRERQSLNPGSQNVFSGDRDLRRDNIQDRDFRSQPSISDQEYPRADRDMRGSDADFRGNFQGNRNLDPSERGGMTRGRNFGDTDNRSGGQRFENTQDMNNYNMSRQPGGNQMGAREFGRSNDFDSVGERSRGQGGSNFRGEVGSRMSGPDSDIRMRGDADFRDSSGPRGVQQQSGKRTWNTGPGGNMDQDDRGGFEDPRGTKFSRSEAQPAFGAGHDYSPRGRGGLRGPGEFPGRGSFRGGRGGDRGR